MRKKSAKCPVCGRPIQGGEAYFSFGAVIDLSVLQRKKLNDDVMEGYCHIGYHGSDPNMLDSANHSVANDVPGGQMDISFCSLVCLKRWFCNIIRKLQQQLAWKKKHGRQTPEEEREDAEVTRRLIEMEKKGLVHTKTKTKGVKTATVRRW